MTTTKTMTFDVARLRIARKLSAAEAALDQALALQSELFSTMLEARRETEAGTFSGHDALLRLAKSQQSLLDAGGDLARVHGRLTDLAQVHCGADMNTCPPNSAVIEAATETTSARAA
jgi:hypothetical protein